MDVFSRVRRPVPGLPWATPPSSGLSQRRDPAAYEDHRMHGCHLSSFPPLLYILRKSTNLFSPTEDRPPFLTYCYLEKISLPLRIPRPKTEGPWRGEWGLSTRATRLWLFMSQPHWGLSLLSASSPWTFEEPSLRTIIKRMAAVRERIMSVWISCSNTSATEYLINTNSYL